VGAVSLAVNVPNPGNYVQQLGQHLIALREAINDLTQDGTYLNAMGGASFLEAAPFSFSPADAQNIANIIGVVTPTNTTVVAINNYLASAVTLTGGG
jgi:hypothetical protein